MGEAVCNNHRWNEWWTKHRIMELLFAFPKKCSPNGQRKYCTRSSSCLSRIRDAYGEKHPDVWHPWRISSKYNWTWSSQTKGAGFAASYPIWQLTVPSLLLKAVHVIRGAQCVLISCFLHVSGATIHNLVGNKSQRAVNVSPLIESTPLTPYEIK